MKAEELLEAIIQIADDKKAINQTTINIAKKSSLADYMLIMEGTSERHVKTLADEIVDKLKEQDVRPFREDGKEDRLWYILDYGDVIVHIFQPETRQQYKLEELWSTKRRKSAAT